MNVGNIIKRFISYIKPTIQKGAVFIINYNMPNEADEIYTYLKENIKYPIDIFLIDNGSDTYSPAKFTNIRLNPNLQMTNGILQGMKALRYKIYKYTSYTIISTSTKFTNKTGDFIKKANILFNTRESCVAYHPSLSPSSRQAFQYMINQPGNRLRKASFLETVCVTYRAKWLDSIGRFDSRFVYGWGIDLETGYFARKQGKSMYLDDSSIIIKNFHWRHKSKRMQMSLENKKKLAMDNMISVFAAKYGKNWSAMIHENVLKEEITGYREFN